MRDCNIAAAKKLAVLVMCLLTVIFIVWGLYSYVEIMLHSNDSLTDIAYEYDNSNMFYWLVNLFEN